MKNIKTTTSPNSPSITLYLHISSHFPCYTYPFTPFPTSPALFTFTSLIIVLSLSSHPLPSLIPHPYFSFPHFLGHSHHLLSPSNLLSLPHTPTSPTSNLFISTLCHPLTSPTFPHPYSSSSSPLTPPNIFSLTFITSPPLPSLSS